MPAGSARPPRQCAEVGPKRGHRPAARAAGRLFRPGTSGPRPRRLPAWASGPARARRGRGQPVRLPSPCGPATTPLRAGRQPGRADPEPCARRCGWRLRSRRVPEPARPPPGRVPCRPSTPGSGAPRRWWLHARSVSGAGSARAVARSARLACPAPPAVAPGCAEPAANPASLCAMSWRLPAPCRRRGPGWPTRPPARTGPRHASGWPRRGSGCARCPAGLPGPRARPPATAGTGSCPSPSWQPAKPRPRLGAQRRWLGWPATGPLRRPARAGRAGGGCGAGQGGQGDGSSGLRGLVGF